MVKMFKQMMLTFVILLSGSAWGIRAVMLSDLNSDTSHDMNMAKTHEHSDLKQPEHDDKTQKPPRLSAIRSDKQSLFGDSSYPSKDFDGNEFMESFIKIFQNLFEPNKKPKVKTIVSLTEVVGPKHPMMPGMQPFRPDQQLSSQFGVKEVGLMDDPFCFDFGKIMHSFIPKISKVDLIMPMKHTHEKHIDSLNNLTDFDFPFGHHHHSKRDLIFPRQGTLEEKSRNGPSLFIKGCSGETPLVSLGEIKLDEAEVTNVEETKDKMCTLIKALPYLEGAIGGVMFVMLILVIASWRIRKPNGIWARVPFVDKSQYIEKV